MQECAYRACERGRRAKGFSLAFSSSFLSVSLSVFSLHFLSPLTAIAFNSDIDDWKKQKKFFRHSISGKFIKQVVPTTLRNLNKLIDIWNNQSGPVIVNIADCMQHLGRSRDQVQKERERRRRKKRGVIICRDKKDGAFELSLYNSCVKCQVSSVKCQVSSVKCQCRMAKKLLTWVLLPPVLFLSSSPLPFPLL